MARILGIDLGANSLGWALIDDYGLNDENSEVSVDILEHKHLIIDGGVRIFPAGYENLGEGEKEQTRNVTRRMARGMRRRYFRRRQRRFKLLNWLKKFGFVPAEVKPEFFTRHDPYALRKKGLEGPLSPEEFAVALYHLNQRRGFKSNRKAGNLSEKSALYKGGEGMIGMNDTLKNFDPETMTFGAYLATLNSKEERRRARYALRSWYEKEFDKLWEAQMFFHPKGEDSPFKVLHDETHVFKIIEHSQKPKAKPKIGFGGASSSGKAKVIYRQVEGHKNYVRNEIIFYQRPLKSQKDKVGMCILEPKSRRCPASHPVAQRFRMLQQVNNLTITSDQPVESLNLFDTGKKTKTKTRKDSPLTERERQLLIDYLSTHESVAIKDLPKVLEIPKSYWEGFKVNLSHQAKIRGCVTNAKIIEAIGRGKRTEEAVAYFNSLPFRDQEQLWRLLYDNDDPEMLAKKVQRKYFGPLGKNWQFDFDDEQAAKFAEIGLEEKYVSLSLKAMNNLLPYMERGLKYHEACKQFTEDMRAAGKNIVYHHSDIESRKNIKVKDRLPLPPDLRNPMVNTALYELRRVVNAIIEKHGRPDIIRIELARELKKNKDERKREHDAIRDNEKLNEEIRERIAQELKKHPLQVKKSDIVKYRLWMECGGYDREEKTYRTTAICPFTGIPIGIADLFNGKVDVEHIIPFSRSLDDSISNKTLCIGDFNKNVKKNLTPYELFSPGPVEYKGQYISYEDVLDRVKNFPRAKRKKFSQESLVDERGETFLSRQLNDTRYMSVAAAEYLRNICPKVEPITGGITALLRETWGLTSKLNEEGDHIKDEKDRAIPFIENPFLDFELHESELNKGGKSRLDHRHHFVDAVVIALTERNAIQKISTEMAADKNIGMEHKELKRALGKRLKSFLKRIPWKRLAPEVKEMLS
ncbi:MAG: type II CRISPR RNA-guided endonuclease Cas9, partial [Bacteroidia bacterium]|nr:type II CRISPR RNA-guided endonuclease Cas9 [Bacteroidia bacterium]